MSFFYHPINSMNSCIVLFSGGIDSTTALYWARQRFDKVKALTFDYGQRHRIEIACSQKITAQLNITQKIVQFDLSQIGGSSLTDPQKSPPQFSSVEEIEKGIPNTYVPFRNGIFLSVAAAWADVIEAQSILVGFNVIDSPSYPDTTESFTRAMEHAVNLGIRLSKQKGNIQILAPFAGMKKSDIISTGLNLDADYSFSVSCYLGKEKPCGHCSSCLLRKEAWASIGWEDHLLVRLKKEETP